MAGYIGSKASVVSSGAERKKTFAITGTTTVLNGLSYTPTFVHLFHNGVRLVDGTDYTATDGTSITLTSAAESGDEVVVISYASFQVADAYTKAEADSAFVSDPNGAVTVDGNGNVGIGAAAPSSDVDILGSSSRIRLDGSSASFQILSRNTADSATNALTFDADSYTFNRAGSTKAVIDSSGYVSVAGNISSNSYYAYDAYVSNSVRLRLKLPDGSDFPKGQAAIVGLFVEGTGTALTTQLYTVTHNGSGTSGISLLQGSSAGVSNRPAMSLDASGYPIIYTGHPNIYSVAVRVMPFRNLA
jgi:hypothetical protein